MTADVTGVKRTREIEEVTNVFVIHPISRALVSVLARWGIHPNTVSIAGMVLGAAAAIAYYQYYRWEMALLGFVLMIGWHILDGTDGQLARLTGKTSELGKILDGVCDHLAFTLVYLSLTIVAAQAFGAWAWGLAALAGVSHVVQASAYEYQRQSYDYWVHSKAAARLATPDELRARLRTGAGVGKVFGYLYLAYVRLQHAIAVIDPRLVAELSRRASGVEREEARQAYREVQVAAVRQWSVMCSNYRTIAIFIACIAGNPLYFFLFEVLVLNAAFVSLRAMQARRNAILLTRLAPLRNGRRLRLADAVESGVRS